MQTKSNTVVIPYGEANKPIPAQKLTTWKNEPSLQQLKADLTASKPSHNTQQMNVTRWNNLRNITSSEKLDKKKHKGRSTIQPKLIRRQNEWRYSALSEPFLSSEKLISVKPRTFEDQSAAKQNALIVNYQFDTVFDKVWFVNNFIRSTADDGTSYVRVGWERQIKKQSKDAPEYAYVALDPENPAHHPQLQELEQALALKKESIRGYNESEIPDELRSAVTFYETRNQLAIAVPTGNTIQVPDNKIIKNRPTIDFIEPENIYIDPSCNGRYKDANFIVISFETSLAELKDGPYKNLKSIRPEGSNPLSEPDHTTKTPDDFNFKDNPRKRMVAYEYWGNYDINGTGELTPIVATWIGDTLIRMEENPYPDGKAPIIVTQYMPIKRSIYGEADAELLEDNQAVLGAVMRGAVDLMGRSANSQQGFAKGFMDVTNRRRFDSGKDYEYNPSYDPKLATYQHSYPELPSSVLTMVQLQNNEAESLTGVKSFSGGVSGEAYGDVAAGIRGVLDAASKREMDILRRCANGVMEIAEKIVAMNQLFLSEEEVVRITNEEFVTVLREELKGSFDLKVDISTPEIDEKRAQDLGFMLQTMGPTMAPEFVQIILAEIAELKGMPALARKIKAYEPTPDPLEEKMKEISVAKAELELQELQSKIALNKAKAEEAYADAAATTNDTENDVSGESERREINKLTAQARGNQDLAVTNAILKGKKEGEGEPDIEAGIGYNAITDQENARKANNEVEDNIGSRFFDPNQDPALNPGIIL